jgi:hypothetical protein
MRRRDKWTNQSWFPGKCFGGTPVFCAWGELRHSEGEDQSYTLGDGLPRIRSKNHSLSEEEEDNHSRRSLGVSVLVEVFPLSSDSLVELPSGEPKFRVVKTMKQWNEMWWWARYGCQEQRQPWPSCQPRLPPCCRAPPVGPCLVAMFQVAIFQVAGLPPVIRNHQGPPRTLLTPHQAVSV